MNGKMTVSKAALVGLFDGLYPNPDGTGPVGPVIRGGWWELMRYRSVVFEPPPKEVPPLDIPPPKGVHPEPRLAISLSLGVIDEAVAIARSAETAGSEERGAAMLASAGLTIRQFVDDFCGNVPRLPVPGLPRWWW